VVPGTHAHTVVDGHRAYRRVREHESGWHAGGQPQLRHDGHEIIAVGAQAVQPDDAGGGTRRGFDLDAGEKVGGHDAGGGLEGGESYLAATACAMLRTGPGAAA